MNRWNQKHKLLFVDMQTQQNAQVASQSYEVSVKIDRIAKLIVSNADEKEFEGK